MKVSEASEIDLLVNKWAEGSSTFDSQSVNKFVAQLAAMFHVKEDEVAILSLAQGGKYLQFLVPEILRAVGTIPLSSTTTLAARTAREKRAEVQNSFAGSRHATVFEGVPMGRHEGEMIQKIMSAPVLSEEKVVGVVQICRKGRTQIQSGADFSSGELRKLQGLGPALARFILLAKKE